MNLIMRIWNSLNEKGRRAWVDTGKAMADMKGGIYAAEEQPQTRSHKFDEKTNRQIDQVIALVNHCGNNVFNVTDSI